MTIIITGPDDRHEFLLLHATYLIKQVVARGIAIQTKYTILH